MEYIINLIFIGILGYAVLAALAYFVSQAVIRIIRKVKRKGAIYV